MIKIEHGVVQNRDGSYQYTYWTAAGLDADGVTNLSQMHVVQFTAAEGAVPEIGDFIDGDVLVKRIGIQSTGGKMKWPGSEKTQNGWWSEHSPDEGWIKNQTKI